MYMITVITYTCAVVKILVTRNVPDLWLNVSDEKCTCAAVKMSMMIGVLVHTAVKVLVMTCTRATVKLSVMTSIPVPQ